MPGVIDPETMNAEGLPGIWSPVQWELTEEQRIHELENQTTASLLWSVDVPEAILRLLLNETEIERVFEPPQGYAPAIQGEWDDEIATYSFKKPIQLISAVREAHSLHLEYKFGDFGYWSFDIEAERVTIERI